jgi:hypothetical protein
MVTKGVSRSARCRPTSVRLSERSSPGVLPGPFPTQTEHLAGGPQAQHVRTGRRGQQQFGEFGAQADGQQVVRRPVDDDLEHAVGG